tara:strand:- start:83085 stop:83417 length:333 start_codon:yes stop_codon:yes gene_type:complete
LTAQVSNETQSEALRIAKGTQKKSQTKEQTKLIAQGIEKGISEYKKQQKIKARERDKQRKKGLVAKTSTTTTEALPSTTDNAKVSTASTRVLSILPWVLLMVSWGYFIFV